MFFCTLNARVWYNEKIKHLKTSAFAFYIHHVLVPHGLMK